MSTVTDAQNQANAISTLITSLSSAPDPNAVRPQIQSEAQTLRTMLYSLANAASIAAQAAAGTTFDSLINWFVATDANLRTKCIDAAISVQTITTVLRQVIAWTNNFGTPEWATTPEVAAQTLINYLANYRTITGT
jgi:hypothetical protein